MNKLQKIVVILTIFFGLNLQSVFASQDAIALSKVGLEEDQPDRLIDQVEQKYPNYAIQRISYKEKEERTFFGTLLPEATGLSRVIRINNATLENPRGDSCSNIQGLPDSGDLCFIGLQYIPLGASKGVGLQPLYCFKDSISPTRYAVACLENKDNLERSLYLVNIETMSCKPFPPTYSSYRDEEGQLLVPSRIYPNYCDHNNSVLFARHNPTCKRDDSNFFPFDHTYSKEMVINFKDLENLQNQPSELVSATGEYVDQGQNDSSAEGSATQQALQEVDCATKEKSDLVQNPLSALVSTAEEHVDQGQNDLSAEGSATQQALQEVDCATEEKSDLGKNPFSEIVTSIKEHVGQGQNDSSAEGSATQQASQEVDCATKEKSDLVQNPLSTLVRATEEHVDQGQNDSSAEARGTISDYYSETEEENSDPVQNQPSELVRVTEEHVGQGQNDSSAEGSATEEDLNCDSDDIDTIFKNLTKDMLLQRTTVESEEFEQCSSEDEFISDEEFKEEQEEDLNSDDDFSPWEEEYYPGEVSKMIKNRKEQLDKKAKLNESSAKQKKVKHLEESGRSRKISIEGWIADDEFETEEISQEVDCIAQENSDLGKNPLSALVSAAKEHVDQGQNDLSAEGSATDKDLNSDEKYITDADDEYEEFKKDRQENFNSPKDDSDIAEKNFKYLRDYDAVWQTIICYKNNQVCKTRYVQICVVPHDKKNNDSILYIFDTQTNKIKELSKEWFFEFSGGMERFFPWFIKLGKTHKCHYLLAYQRRLDGSREDENFLAYSIDLKKDLGLDLPEPSFFERHQTGLMIAGAFVAGSAAGWKLYQLYKSGKITREQLRRYASQLPEVATQTAEFAQKASLALTRAAKDNCVIS